MGDAITVGIRALRRTLLAVLLSGLCLTSALRRPQPTRAGFELVESANAALSATPLAESRIPALLSADPLAFLKQARNDYDRRVRDYVCRFTKQERVAGVVGPLQVADVKFREGPFSVFLHILQNADKARRVLYVKDALVREGAQYCTIEPEGAIARLLVPSVERPIDGPEARRASRKTVADFGFARSLDLIIQYADIAARKGLHPLQYLGPGTIDGRPTYVLERRLPVESPADTSWPDALLVLHLDQEWLVPVSCTAYSDPEGRVLLGEYVYTNVSFNVGLLPRDFDPATYGL
jgi:hypothetical protein